MMPLEEVISPEMAADFIDSEYLKTVCVVVPKSVLLMESTLIGWIARLLHGRVLPTSQQSNHRHVVIPKVGFWPVRSAEADFVTSYASIGNDIAGFGGPDWSVQTSQIGKLDNNYGPYCDRRAVSGSPAVPGSHK